MRLSLGDQPSLLTRAVHDVLAARGRLGPDGPLQACCSAHLHQQQHELGARGTAHPQLLLHD